MLNNRRKQPKNLHKKYVVQTPLLKGLKTQLHKKYQILLMHRNLLISTLYALCTTMHNNAQYVLAHCIHNKSPLKKGTYMLCGKFVHLGKGVRKWV
jgi:hypothetical protein